MGDTGKEVHLLNTLDFRHDSKLDCPVSSRLETRIDLFESKLALRASLRYTGEDDQWQTNCRSLRDRNKYMFNRELFSDVRFLVGRREKTSIPAHRYILAISSPVFSSLFYAFGALQTEFTAREQVSKHIILSNELRHPLLSPSSPWVHIYHVMCLHVVHNQLFFRQATRFSS